MTKLLPILLLLAIPLHAQKLDVGAPVYGCKVLDTGTADGSGQIVFGIYADGALDHTVGVKSANTTVDMAAVCKSEISKMQAVPITLGDVSIPVTVDPVVIPTDPALDAFLILVKKARALLGIVPTDSKVLAGIVAQIESSLEAHPEYLDSI